MEYSAKARKIDKKYHRVQGTGKEPVKRKQESLGELQHLVLGQFGEVASISMTLIIPQGVNKLNCHQHV